MPAKKLHRVKARGQRPAASLKRAGTDAPQFFRLNVEVGNLDAGVAFYSKLLGMQGRQQGGSRCYFQCGPVTLSVLDVSSVRQPHPAPKALYFTVEHLEGAIERRRILGCLLAEDAHDPPGGGIFFRPCGAGSLYAEDVCKIPLC